MKKLILSLMLTLPIIGFSQDNDPEEKSNFNQFLNNLSGSFESNIQWYNNDKALGSFSESTEAKDIEGKNKVRANSYLKLDYSFLKNFTVGVQVESYAPMSLLNYSLEYDDTNVAQYYANFRNDKLDITAGYFYEQFGSGLLLRGFEERQLGLNTSIRGGRIKFRPFEALNLTALYGKQRIGLDEFFDQKVSKGSVLGFDTELDLKSAFKINNISTLNIGASYVGKNESFENAPDGFPEQINSYAVRLDADFGNIFANIEYNIKGEDVVLIPDGAVGGGAGTPVDGKYFDGSGLLFTLGYTKKGFGISNTFRRLENMNFFSERDRYNIATNPYNLASMNFLPALTKQQDYSLANIYVYSAQSGLNFEGSGPRSGEIGTQLDVFYKIPKGTKLGGKYGTKLTANFAYWSIIEGTFDVTNYTYESEFINFKNKVYKDFNVEMRKKWTPKFNSIVTYINSEINKNVALGGPVNPSAGQKLIKSNILILDGTYKLANKQSARLELQHLWTKEDDKNWAGGTFEYNFNRSLSAYVTDMWNYGGGYKNNVALTSAKAEHYYNLGASLTKGSTRVAFNYGRQRGGLFCVGGVCREVSPNTGLTVNLTTSF